MDLCNEFFGRNVILELLHKRVVDLKDGYRQNIAFLGQRYVGKSSILTKFIADLDDDQVIDIYLNLEYRDPTYIFHKMIGSMLYNFAKRKCLPLHEDEALLMETTRPLIPQTVEEIKRIKHFLAQNKRVDAYRALMTLPELFIIETNMFCVLLLDEFQNLVELGIPQIFKELGKKIMTQKRCLYIMASSFPGIARKILSEKLALLFGNFEEILIGPFDINTSQDFIEFHLKEIPIGVQLRNFLIDFTGGHPLFLHLICQEIEFLSALHKQQEIYMPLLVQAIENTIFNPWGAINRHFELIMNELSSGKGQTQIGLCLMLMAEGKNKLKELAEGLKVLPRTLTPKVQRVVESGLIVRNGSNYYFQDKLFKYWLKFVYRKKIRALDFNPEYLRRELKEELNSLIDHFKLTSRKDLSSRIVELLYCFNNESYDLNGRKYKLPVFKEIIPSKLRNMTGNYFEIIKALSQDDLWFIVLKQDPLLEGDVYAILSEVKKLPQRPTRYILIAFSDLDENARLKALQEKFWIWHEDEINTLLSIYDKSYIVR